MNLNHCFKRNANSLKLHFVQIWLTFAYYAHTIKSPLKYIYCKLKKVLLQNKLNNNLCLHLKDIKGLYSFEDLVTFPGEKALKITENKAQKPLCKALWKIASFKRRFLFDAKTTFSFNLILF